MSEGCIGRNASGSKAVVIGSGLGGLTCGSFLARDGYSVTVLEKHDKLGGYATSFRQGDFTFDVSLHALPVGDNPTTRMLRHLGVLEQLEFVKLPELHRIVAPGYDITFPNADPSGYASTLARVFPAERRGIHGFVERVVGVARDAEKLHSRDDRYFAPFFPFQYRSMWKTRGLTLDRMLGQHVTDPDLKALMSVLWCYYGLPPSSLSAFYFSVATGQYLANGASYPMKRSQDLSNSLVGVIQGSGGKVHLNTEASTIRLNSHLALGVEDVRGGMHDADIIVSNASAGLTFNKLINGVKLPSGPQRKLDRYRSKLGTYRPSLSSFVVWLGLDQDIRDRVAEAEIFLLPKLDHEALYRASLQGDPERSLLAVTIYDNVFSGYSPAGKSTMMIMFLCSHDAWKPYQDGYSNGNREGYLAQKKRVAEIVVDRVEEALLPGLRSMIEESDASTPLTNIRFTGNCGGAIYGYEQSLDNTFINRIDNRTPIPNVYLASAWTSPGGGFAGAMRSGQKAWRAIRKDTGR